MQRHIADLFESILVFGIAAVFSVAILADMRTSEPSGARSLVAQQANLLVAQHGNDARRG